MTQDVRNDSRFCQMPQGSKKDLNRHLSHRTIFMAVGLSFILTSTVMYGLMIPPTSPPPPPSPPPSLTPLQLTPHAPIAIDTDANFAATALLEGWPGDGSSENPFIIDGLEIDIGGEVGHCISINNTRVHFAISNCKLTGGYSESWDMLPGAGIYLENVTNGELVNNKCDSNYDLYGNYWYGDGIRLYESDSNTVFNNTCNRNDIGVSLWESETNTVENNTCDNNNLGIWLVASNSNTVENNTCNSNDLGGIFIDGSCSNTLANNTCTYNAEFGIHLYSSDYNTVAINTCNNNDIGISIDDLDTWPIIGWGEFIESHSNTVADNICNNNRIGIYIHFFGSYSNNVVNNNFSGNTEHDILLLYDEGILDLLLIGLVAGIILLGAGWRMAKLSRVA